MGWKKWLPILGILLFVYILLSLDLSEVIGEIKNANLGFLMIAMAIIFLTCITQTLKWFAIAKAQKTDIPFFEAFNVNLISNFYGFITPARLGSVVRANYLKKYNQNKIGKGLNNFFLDKILDLISVVFLMLVFSFIFWEVFPNSYLYLSLGIFFLLIFTIIIYRDEVKSKKISKVFYRFLPEKIKPKAKEVFYSLYENSPRKKFFIFFFLLNVLNWIAIFSSSYFVGLAVGINLPITYFLAIFPIATLISQIPITISGLGTREAAMISLFGLFGIGAVKVFSMSVIGLVLGIIPMIIGGILVFRYKLE